MKIEEKVAEEFAVPEFRERLRRAYRRLAAQAQKREQMRAAAPVAAGVPAADEHMPKTKQPAYVQLRMF